MLKTNIKQQFLNDRANWILWFPALFAAGISVYFSIDFEPDLNSSFVLFGAASSLCFLYRRRKYIFVFALISLAVISGFLCANLRAVAVNSPVIYEKTGVREIEAVIHDIQSTPSGLRFILKDLQIENLPQEKTPKLIRININTDSAGAGIGDKISLLAALNPPPVPVVAGGYDFARYIYFERIGAVGYSVSAVKIIGHAKDMGAKQYISSLRWDIIARIMTGMENKTNGNIAAALLVGEQGGIDKKTLDEIRISGIAHILSISGMHLSLVAALFFFSFRMVMAAIPAIALRFNIKKWAALVAIAGSLFYLFISGSPVPAQRAFIMTTLILFAVIIDRNGAPMRSIALAAMIILIFMPESLLNPGFQMSFAAVIALISGFEAMKPLYKNYESFGIFRKFMMYFVGVVMSSLIAGMATAPFALYHFNNYSTYGLLTNMLAVPLSSFVIMPAGVVAILLMPFGLEAVGLVPMEWGIGLMLRIAEWVASFPQSSGNLPQLPVASFILIITGGLWLCLWQKKWRRLGIIPIIASLPFVLMAEKPDFLINDNGRLFTIIKGDKMLSSSNRAERYTASQWKKEFGIDEMGLIDGKAHDIKCDEYGCIFNKDGKKLVIAKHIISLQEDCAEADILINLTHFNPPCKSFKKYINRYDLKHGGTHIIYMSGDIKVSKSVENNGRLWQRR